MVTRARREPSARRIVLAAATTSTALVLLFGYHTSSPGGAVVAAATAPDPSAGTGTSSGTTSSDTGTAGSGSGSSGATRTVTGDAVSTRWGTVQVQITVSGGQITAAEAVEYPTGNPKDVSINSRALPVLESEVLQAQSGDIDTVSGATVTSDGYIESLQSALDAAGL